MKKREGWGWTDRVDRTPYTKEEMEKTQEGLRELQAEREKKKQPKETKKSRLMEYIEKNWSSPFNPTEDGEEK